MNKEAIILAGGLGTRLKEVVSDVPKQMAPVNNRPFLEYILDHLIAEGFKHVILSVGYKYQLIKQHFGNKYQNLELEYVLENEPMGTGGAIGLSIEKVSVKDIVVLNGDTFFPINFKLLFEHHQEKESETTIALKKVTRSDRYGTIQLNDTDQIIKFEEKGKSGVGLINGGCYLINIQRFIARGNTDKFSFETDYLEKVVSEKCLYGRIFESYFIDIGVPESYAQAQFDFRKGDSH